MSLLERLKQLQGDKSQAEFAAELGITQPTLSRIYSGNRRIGARAARAIGRRYPQLSNDLAFFCWAQIYQVYIS